MNAGCREKDLAHIGKHLDKFTVRYLLQSNDMAVMPTGPNPLTPCPMMVADTCPCDDSCCTDDRRLCCDRCHL